MRVAVERPLGDVVAGLRLQQRHKLRDVRELVHVADRGLPCQALAQVEELVEVLVVGRAGYASLDGGLELPNVSSSAIRRMLAQGDDPSALVPAAVLAYIGQEGFYQSTEQ